MSRNPNNICSFIGRLVRDPELRKTAAGVSVCSLTLAVDRNYPDENGNWPVDYIDCVAWKKRTENIAQKWKKGDLVTVTGSLQVRAWSDKDGNKRYTTEVIVDSRRKLVSAGKALSDIPRSVSDYPPMPTDADLPSDYLETDPFDDEIPSLFDPT